MAQMSHKQTVFSPFPHRWWMILEEKAMDSIYLFLFVIDRHSNVFSVLYICYLPACYADMLCCYLPACSIFMLLLFSSFTSPIALHSFIVLSFIYVYIHRCQILHIDRGLTWLIVQTSSVSSQTSLSLNTSTSSHWPSIPPLTV